MHVQPRAGGGGFGFVPLHVRRRERYGSTLALSRSSQLMAMGGNGTATGYDVDE